MEYLQNAILLNPSNNTRLLNHIQQAAATNSKHSIYPNYPLIRTFPYKNSDDPELSMDILIFTKLTEYDLCVVGGRVETGFLCVAQAVLELAL